MNAVRVVELMNEHAECPICGNCHLRNGEGTLEVTHDTFIRSCKCGYRIVIREGELDG